MGAGILPVAFQNGRAYFLFSRERSGTSYKDSGLWSDFGGKTEKGETHWQTAVREAHEESMGLMGTCEDIIDLLKNCLIGEIDVGCYKTYIVEVAYDESVPATFRQEFKNAPSELLNVRNGLYEKDEARWIRLENVGRFSKRFRSWYKYSGIPRKAVAIVSAYMAQNEEITGV